MVSVSGPNRLLDNGFNYAKCVFYLPTCWFIEAVFAENTFKSRLKTMS